MKVFLVLAIVVVGARAGEWGVRWESPQASLAWVSQSWPVGDLTLAARAEVQPFPLRFGRATLSLSGAGSLIQWKLETALFGSGRIDAFLSASFSQPLVLALAAGRLAGGGKAGWAAVNLAPLWLGTGWALAEVEVRNWTGKLQVEGPPFSWTLGLSGPSLALSLGRALAVELWGTHGDWTLSTQIQILPVPAQRVALAWATPRGTARLWLDLRGGGLSLAHSQTGQSLLFSLLWGTGVRGTVEIVGSF